MSRSAARFRPAASDDIDEIALQVSSAGISVGFRFYAAVHADAERLTAFPGLGPPYVSTHPNLHDVRVLPVSEFRKYLMFYRPLPEGGIEVIRVLHGARDVPRVLGTS